MTGIAESLFAKLTDAERAKLMARKTDDYYAFITKDGPVLEIRVKVNA